MKESVKRTLRWMLPLVLMPLLVVLGGWLLGERFYAWGILGMVILSQLLFFVGFERKTVGTRRLVVAAVMTALSVMGRIIFAPIPGFKPITAIVVITGIWIGGETGFLTGSLSALISNFFSGQGPWTPFQMFAWGMLGLLAGLLSDGLKQSRIALAAYGLLLGLLVWAEGGQGGDPIDSLPEALWYSLVTLTTVGYGDLYPRTPVGRLVGLVFLLMSTGLLALLIGVVIASLTNRLLPGLRLWLNRGRRWYVFSTDNAASRTLAGRLDDGFIVYCRSDACRQLADGLALPENPETLFDRPVARKGERLFFAMDKDALANERDALALGERPRHIFCRTEAPG